MTLQTNWMTMMGPKAMGEMASRGAPPVMVLLMTALPAYW